MKNLDYLGERLSGDDLQLVAIDMRGRGKSQTTPPGSYGWENHALDVLAVAEALGFDRFGLIGQSMGGSVAMKVAEIDASRLTSLVLMDIAGRVDPGVGSAISAVIGQLDQTYDSVESYLAAKKALGLIEPWSDFGIAHTAMGSRSKVAIPDVGRPCSRFRGSHVLRYPRPRRALEALDDANIAASSDPGASTWRRLRRPS